MDDRNADQLREDLAKSAEDYYRCIIGGARVLDTKRALDTLEKTAYRYGGAAAKSRVVIK